MATPDGDLVVVFNGEIYNHAELRESLKQRGHTFVTDHSDTEVLLHGYREWAGELPSRLNGMWAFAIHDRPKRLLFCSRDRFGKKPFFYCSVNGAFVFASELTSIVRHPAVSCTISRRSLQKYFAYGYVPAPSSILEGVSKLPGGFSLWLNTDTLALRLEKYWEFLLEPFESVPRNPDETWGEELRELLERAVKRRLVADVPLGVFLSGGIDSSAITAMASRHIDSQKLKTFSVGFEEASFDETPFARTVAGKFQTDHREQTLSMGSIRKLLPQIISKLDEPMGDSSLLPTYLLSRFTREHVTVALAGDGGDELFAGYDPFAALKKARLYQRLVPRPIHEAIRLLFGCLPVSHKRMSLDFKIKRTLRGLSHPAQIWLPVWMGPLDPMELADLFSSPPEMEDVYSEAIEAWESNGDANPVDRALQFFTRLYLQDDILVKADRASMMNALEIRAPFLDIDLVDFIRRIPWQWKYRAGQRKYLLKKALEPLLPREILYRAKQGFGVPIGKWFREGGLKFDLINRPIPMAGSFVASKIDSHRSRQTDERIFLWNSWVLDQWMQKLEDHGEIEAPFDRENHN
jgi:asparagine synthase (glutamine-hydrolysing)